jgi:hypothetical protein
MPPINNNQNNNFNQQTQPPMANGPIPQVTQDSGKTFSIIGLVLVFLPGLQLLGLILSIVGLSKAKKAGAPKGMSITAIILNITAMIVWTSLIFAVVIKAVKSTETNPDDIVTTIKDNTVDNNTKTDSDSSKTTKPLAVTASDIYDMNKVCKNNYSIANSGTYSAGSLNKVAAFYNTNQSKNIYTYLQSSKESWIPNLTSDVGIIVCADFSEGESAGKNCDYVSDGENVSIPLYRSSYTLRVIEAYTGNQISTTYATTSTDECPSYVTYNKTDPKVYQDLDFDILEGVLTPYAG